MLAPTLITPPAETPISVDEAKAHLNVTHSNHDEVIEAYLGAAVSYLDGYSGVLGRCMVTQTWRQGIYGWPGDSGIRLPFPDVSAVVLKYSDADDAEQTVSGSLYQVLQDARGSFISLRSAFSAPSVYSDRIEPIRADLTAGYGAAEDVPAALKSAIKLMVGHLYEQREDTVVGVGIDVRTLPMGFAALIAPFRRVGL